MLDIGAAVLEASLGVPLASAAAQLLDFGERNYPSLFPGHPVTSSTSPFIYRYYPATGLYLGVVVQSDSAYVLQGIYLLGGAWGNTPHYLGRVSDYIVPR